MLGTRTGTRAFRLGEKLLSFFFQNRCLFFFLRKEMKNLDFFSHDDSFFSFDINNDKQVQRDRKEAEKK